MSQPNLLFVFADQMRGMDMGCAGNPDVHTPAINRLASQGVRLTHHFATTPVCGPNRGTLLTGTYATTHHVLGNDLPVRTDLPSIGTVAKAHGYRTGYIGKWHLDGMPRDKFTPPGNRRLGFDDWAVYNCAHRYFEPKYYTDTDELIQPQGYEPEVQTDLALSYLDGYSRGKQPFCLVLSWGPPHDPYHHVPEAYRARYDPAAITLRPNAQPEATNPLVGSKTCRRTIADYYAAITALDEQFGRLLDKLDEMGVAENTIVVFTSDHGDMLWSHGWMKKQLPHEESISVPVVMRWPGRLPAGATCETLLGTVDVFPTLAGLLGWQLPDEVEGTDLACALREPSAHAEAIPSVFLANYSAPDEGARQGVPIWRGVRTRRWTYVESLGRKPWLMFDNSCDPYQMTNRIDDPACAEAQTTLQKLLGKWLEKTHDPFLDTEPMMAHFAVDELWRQRERKRVQRGSHASM